MPELVAPATRLHRAWLAAHAEWGPGFHEDGFGLEPSDEVTSPDGFAAFVARLLAEPGATYRWLTERGEILGGIALRHGSGDCGSEDCDFEDHGSEDYVSWAGHLGFGIRPTARRRGLGAWALSRMLDEARALGLGRVLLVCEPGNTASAKTIERAGGVFEDVRTTVHGPARRYWITLTGPPP